jgi:hypothetical protein
VYNGESFLYNVATNVSWASLTTTSGYTFPMKCDLATGEYKVRVTDLETGFSVSTGAIAVTAANPTSLAFDCQTIDLGTVNTSRPSVIRTGNISMGDYTTSRPNKYNSTSFPSHTNPQPSGEVVYKFTGNYPKYSVKLCGSDFDTYLHILGPNKNLIAENDDSQGYIFGNGNGCGRYTSSQSELVFSASGSGPYYIVVEGKGNASGTVKLNLSIYGNPSGREGAGDEDHPITDLSLHPNPAYTDVVITLPSNEPANVKLIDLIGRVVKETIANNLESIDVSALPSGIYIALITHGGKVHMKKLQVMK